MLNERHYSYTVRAKFNDSQNSHSINSVMWSADRMRIAAIIRTVKLPPHQLIVSNTNWFDPTRLVYGCRWTVFNWIQTDWVHGNSTLQPNSVWKKTTNQQMLGPFLKAPIPVELSYVGFVDVVLNTNRTVESECKQTLHNNIKILNQSFD